MMPGTHYFNMPYVYRLSGNLDLEALQKTLREIIRRHEALRTVFEEIDGRPVQIIKNEQDFNLEIIDFPDKSVNEALQTAAEQIVQERWSPFDLVSGPLHRLKLLRLTATEALLLVTVHHIISDHWSMQLFRDDLIEIYRAIMQGCPLSLREPQLQFGDYAVWERQLLDTGQFNDLATYWIEHLTTKRSNQGHVTNTTHRIAHEFHRHAIDIDANLLSRIKRFAVQQNCTPSIVVLSAAFVMSYLILGEPEIRCGILMFNRWSKELERTIGHFLNTVVIYARLSPGDTFEDIVKQIRALTLAAHAKQALPFEQLKRAMSKQNEGEGDSFIRVLLNYQKRTFSPVHASGLTISPFSLPTEDVESESLPAAYDLIFDIKELDMTLVGTTNIAAGIIKRSGARHADISLREILTLMVSQSRKSLSDLCDVQLFTP